MNIINVGFNSKNWDILVETSEQYRVISQSLDNENSEVAYHIIQTINNLVEGDYNTAYREAHKSIRIARGESGDNLTEVRCPFCNGDGVLETEQIPMRGGYQDPTDAVDAEVMCNACKGAGKLDATVLLNDFADSSYPEHVVMSVIKGNMIQAKSLAQAVVGEIKSHESANLEASVERAS